MRGSGRGSFVANCPWRSCYFVCQAVATLAWWLVIAASPAARRWFAFGDTGGSLMQFLPGDVLFWVVGSGLAAWGERRHAWWRRPVQHAVGGAMACSLVHAASAAAITGTGYAGVLLMLPAVAMTGWLAWCSEC